MDTFCNIPHELHSIATLVTEALEYDPNIFAENRTNISVDTKENIISRKWFDH